MISLFPLFFAMIGARKQAVDLGMMVSKSLIDSVPADRPPMSFQMGLQRRGRAFRPWDPQDEDVCYLNKIRHEMDTVISEMICGHPITKHILTEKICGRGKPSCFHCHTDFVNFHGHQLIEVASCIPPSIYHFDHETVSHICDSTVRSISLGVCENSNAMSFGALHFVHRSNASQQQKDTFNFECCKAKLSKPANQMINCSPKGFKTREYELSIEKISGKIERINVPISIPKRCCAEI